MTVRELMNKIIEEAPNLDAEIFFHERYGLESINFKVFAIDSFGAKDSLFIELIKRTI